ncbi:ribosome biogenesis GTP-binding protein YihA/YsxC [Tunicatimonas pelagia]|uniref:ribosome biogenesis GTP-binding protein YihA/YsxC n=1 Tax=Tunicatimonas pelagia TaxID=931531 RepID=UPI002665B0E1|nr:ribosome biogenesis GTP-binding protein YihA/YsxC [Tunicatimonas pelagia]WKN41470.1 ribosome biogenesis GTP-binding protein YihA/YsxC [Tunicatimonas pelagia]
MKIKQSEFVKSSVELDQCPEGTLPEFAFIGRSNVGKSSLINMLTERRKLAKTSNTPGKTQTINHFLINQQWYLVDLPGYGYAKVSKTTRDDWGKMIENYLLNRQQLVNLFVLIDSRIPPQNIDLSFIDWLGQHAIPFTIIFTKADKQNEKKTRKSIRAFQEAMRETWEELPPMLTSSSVTKAGREDILEYLGGLLVL